MFILLNLKRKELSTLLLSLPHAGVTDLIGQSPRTLIHILLVILPVTLLTQHAFPVYSQVQWVFVLPNFVL